MNAHCASMRTMLVDDVTIRVKAGDGGAGAVAFNKVKKMLGPVGGDGGRGASVYFEGVRDVGALDFFARRKEVLAKNGGNGRGQFIDGKDGEDLVLRVPTGTLVRDTDTGEVREVNAEGERILAAKGGRGGRGNFKFRSSINTSPLEHEDGVSGESHNYHLELRLIADVGLIGLPNAGKSSLLNELTGAKSKVANYAFTTLEPHLGAYFGLIIADIPGLIEGASEGKGLGHKFLKHVRRTEMLFHLISAESDDAVRDYKTVRAELAAYDPALAEKKEYVFLTKCDMVSKETVDASLAALKKAKVAALPLSLLEPETMERVKKILAGLTV